MDQVLVVDDIVIYGWVTESSSDLEKPCGHDTGEIRVMLVEVTSLDTHITFRVMWLSRLVTDNHITVYFSVSSWTGIWVVIRVVKLGFISFLRFLFRVIPVHVQSRVV